MILNIIPDDKFVPFLQGLFDEASPGDSLWRVVTDKPKSAYSVQTDNTEIINFEYYDSEEFINDLQVVNCVIFHSLTLSIRHKLLLLSRIPKNMPIVWRGWGFDYYGFLEANGLRLILPETSSLIKKPSVMRRVFAKPLTKNILRAIYSKTLGEIIKNKFVARINYFSCCVPDDYEALQRALPNLKARFIPLNYYSAEDVFLHGDNLQDLTGSDILLGNSSTATNNHIEIMRVLSKLGMHGRKVIVPLSYGDMEYREKVIQAGEKLLGESFIPLKSYMSLSEYNQAVSNCGNLIMNHIRQQAMGNISSALLRGGKVFLRPENPIYKHYSRMGIKLFPLSDDITIVDLDVPLKKEDSFKNKEILMSIWSRAQGIKNVKAIFSLGR